MKYFFYKYNGYKNLLVQQVLADFVIQHCNSTYHIDGTHRLKRDNYYIN